MLMVQLACPKCGFVIEQYGAEQLETDAQKQKRYQYLRKKQSLCPSCLTQTAKLEERRVELEAPPQAELMAEAEAPPEARPEGEAVTPTPFCDELERGPWTSHVTELKQTRYHMQMYEEGLRQKRTQWGFGGYTSIPGVASGILMRASARPDIAKGANLVRAFCPSGTFYSTKTFRALCDVADRHGYGILHLHATTCDIEVLGVPKEELRATVDELVAAGLDVGSTGDAYRNCQECIGPLRCEMVLVDSVAMRQAYFTRFLDDVQYPRFPHKIKFKLSGCPNDCTRSQQKGDIAIVGVFRDPPRIDEARLDGWVKNGGDLAHVVRMCPTRAMEWDGRRLTIDADACVRCMYCINKCPAIRPGGDRGVAVLAGGKMRGKYGPLQPFLIAPFVSAIPPDFKEVFDLCAKITDVYDEHARRKERLGDFIYRTGIDEFCRLVGVAPTPQQMVAPRINPFYHWTPEELQASPKEA